MRIVELETSTGDVRYRFEDGDYEGRTFEDPATATLYADIYFCTNGFEEEGIGERGVPPEIIAAGRAVLAAYFLTQPSINHQWVASFFGMKPHRIREYADWVRERAEQIRTRAEVRGIE
nr:hypothetical protein [Halegenticoccus tardaugens]